MLNLREYAQLSLLLYNHNAAICIDQAFPGVFDDVLEYEVGHLKAVCCVDAKNQQGYVVFKGFEWYPGSLFKMLSFKPGQKQIHPALLKDFEMIYEHLSEALYSMREECTEIHACGHSWGGALAAVLATTETLGSVTTFGQPRIGSSDNVWRSMRCHTYTRVVNAGDLLCEVPFGFGYGHHGAEILMSSNPDHSFENANVIRRWVEHGIALLKANFAQYHRMSRYLERMKSL